MVAKKHVALILLGFILISLYFSGQNLPHAFAAVQKTFVLNPSAANFTFQESEFNDSSSSNEYSFPNASNVTYWASIPKNSTIVNVTMTLTGKIIYVYSVQASPNGIKSLSIGNATGTENQISLGTQEGSNMGKVKLLYGNNGSSIWNSTVSPNKVIYSTSVGNLTNDAGSEIAVGSEDNKITILSSAGSMIWENSSLGGAVKSVKIGDIYGNGVNFVVAGFSSTVRVFNSSSGVNWSTVVTGCTLNDLAIGNFSADPGNEIIVGCDLGKIFILNATGSTIANMTIGSSSINSVDVGNVTSDPGNEIAAGSGDKKIYVINGSGSTVWSYSTGYYVNSVKIGDVTTQYPGNEVVAGSDDQKVYTLDSSGNLIWSFDAGSYINIIGIGNLTADASNESINEVAAGAGDGSLYVFNFDYFPDNVSIAVGSGGYSWNYPGKLRSTVQAGGTAGFANSIQSYLNNNCTPVSGMCTVPLLFHSDWAGKLNISGLNITYSYNISNLVSSAISPVWSRTWNVHVNESVGNQTWNLSFTPNPANSISVHYIRINTTATACDFNGSSNSVSTVDGQTTCDVPDFIIPSSGAVPGPYMLWDNTMTAGTPVLMNESAAYYANVTDSFLWRKNLTIWNTTSTVIYNVTANATINDAAVRGEVFLNVTWKGVPCEITPSAICPSYSAKDCSGDIFYACRQDTNANGVYDFFNWTQPYASSYVNYTTGGSTNLAANLSGQNATPSSAIWGGTFNYSVSVNDTESDTVNVKLWIRRNLSSSWEMKSDQNISGSGNFSYSSPTDSSWVGLASYLFQFQDFNSSWYPIHSARNTSAFSNPLVLRHNVSVELIQGNNSEVNRTQSILLAVRINDTENNTWADINGTRCAFWVTRDGSAFGQAVQNLSNSSGYCEYLFAPDGNYSAQNQTWKAGVVNDTYYSDGNSSDFMVSVKGKVSIAFVSPVANQVFRRNYNNTFEARMIDEYGAAPSGVSGYTCTFWFINQSGPNMLGNGTTNASGWCSYVWNPGCSVLTGQFTVNVTLTGSSQSYFIQSGENDTQIYVKDSLQTMLISPSPYSSHHKGDSVQLSSSVNDTCLLCSDSDSVSSAWNLKLKQSLRVDLNETRGFSMANETIIINGSELGSNGIDLSDWRIGYTKVLVNGQEVPSEVKAWTDSSKTQINSSQVFMNNYSELIFLASLSGLQNSAYWVYYNESNPSDWNISYIANGGFEGGILSPWACVNSSGCSLDMCDCRVTSGSGETAGNYSLRIFVSPNVDYTNMSVKQSIPEGINSSYIKIRYKPVNMTSGFSAIKVLAGSGSCSLSVQPAAWTETLCYNASFQNATWINVTVDTTSKDGSYRYLYIDYVCIADSSGSCVSLDSGYSPQKTLVSQTSLGAGNTSWTIQPNETLGARRVLVNSSGPNHFQNFSAVNVLLFGMSNMSWINLSSSDCLYNQTFECMSNATIDFYCQPADVNTSQGIRDYNVSFFVNSTIVTGGYLGSNMTNSSGFASFRWVNSTSQIGTYNITCNISDTVYEPNTYYNITANNSRNILLEIISGNTTGSILLLPAEETAPGITREQNHSFLMNVTINNTGNGSMYNPMVNISSPSGIYVQQMSCPPLPVNSTCSSSLQANVTRSAAAENLTVNVTILWSNADHTQGNATSQAYVLVQNHTALNITQAQLNMTISRGDSRTAGNFTVEAYGNTNISGVQFSLSGANSSAILDWRSYSPSSISDISKSGSQVVLVNLTVPSNAQEGMYAATLLSNATASFCSPASECWDTLSLTVNVTPPDWDMAPANLSKTVGLEGVNGSIGTITVTNNRNQNYSFTVNVTGNGSSYIRTDKTSFNLSSLSSTYVHVYHNTTGAYNPGYWYGNVTVANSDGSAFPHNMSTAVNFNVINLTISIVSPNGTNPTTTPVNASDRINISVNATLSGSPQSSNMTWSVSVGGQACADVQSSFNSSTGFWDMNCTAPDITGNVIYNGLSVTGNYTAMQGAIVSDEEAAAVRYQDITPPQPRGISVSPVSYSSSTPYIIINATITDNTLVNSSWLVITQPNGANASVYNPSNLSSLYTFNFSNPNIVGDYDVYVFANDSYGYANSTKGWFDVYRPFTISGLLTDPSSANLSANFTFYRNATSTIIHSFSTNSSQSFYNWSVHDRIYDVRLSFFGQTVVLYGVNTTASALIQHNSSATNVSSVFRFDNYPNLTAPNITRISLPNTAWHRIMAFVIETPNLSYSSSVITIDYSSARDIAAGTITDLNENNLRVFRCANWNFFTRTCSDAGGTFSHFNESLTPSGGTFTFAAAPSTAYAVAETCYPNICGQSTPTQPPGGGTETPSSRSGPAVPVQAVCGNGKCETGENSQNCAKDCSAETDPFTVKTGVNNIRMRPGDKATYPLLITNRLNRTITAEISMSGLESYFKLEKTSVAIGANKTETVNVYVTIPETAETGTYTGTITVSSEGRSRDIPITMVISLEERSQLNMRLNLLTTLIQPGDDLKYSVELINIGFRDNISVDMIYTIRSATTGETIKQDNETLNLSLGTGGSWVISKVTSFRDIEINPGRYSLEVDAVFGNSFVREKQEFEVVQVFWVTPFGQFATWFVIVGAIVVIAYYERRRYTRWKMKKSRYIFPVNYSKIPQETEEAFWIGKVAETDKKAWFNPNDLTTHVLVAGSTGAGKSVAASVFVEEALDKKIPVVVFDPTAQWTGFVKQCEDENLLKYYPQFGMDPRYARPYKGMIQEVTDPHLFIDFKKYMNPGEITVFTMNKLGPGEYDVAVKNIINAIFKAGWEESTKLRMIMVFDEVHRLLEKYGGIGGYISLEQACREFRKWGIAVIMCSQVLADFKEAIAGNVLTDVQMNTKSLIDIRKVETKYGPEYATRISRQGVGVGMVQNPKYNEGKPYFVQFRPTWHNPHKITDEELQFYKEFAQRLEIIEKVITDMKSQKRDVADIEIELKLAKDKLKQGRFRMAKIYITSLEEHLNIRQET